MIGADDYRHERTCGTCGMDYDQVIQDRETLQAEIERLQAIVAFLHKEIKERACWNPEDESWNPDHHLEITITIAEARLIFEAYKAAGGE